MSAFKLIALVVLVALAGTLVQPAPAEALEPMTILTIVGVAVGVVLIIAVVVIANIREKQGGMAADEPAVVAFDMGAVEGL